MPDEPMETEPAPGAEMETEPAISVTPDAEKAEESAPSAKAEIADEKKEELTPAAKEELPAAESAIEKKEDPAPVADVASEKKESPAPAAREEPPAAESESEKKEDLAPWTKEEPLVEEVASEKKEDPAILADTSAGKKEEAAIPEKMEEIETPEEKKEAHATKPDLLTRAELARETYVPTSAPPPLRQTAVLGGSPLGMLLIGTNGGAGGMRGMIRRVEPMPAVVRTEARAGGPVRQRYKAFLQTTVYKDHEPRAKFTPLFTPAQMQQEVRNFRPVPILIDHETHQPSIGTMEKIWIEPFDGQPSLCGQLYFHMQNDDSRRVVEWLQSKGGADLSLGCDHGYDPTGTKMRTLIREISVVAVGNYDGCFVRTNASALKINSDERLTLPLSCYIELGNTTYRTMASNEAPTETAPPAEPAPPAAAAPVTISPEIALRVYKQDSALAEESRRIGTAQVKAFADLHEQACADASKLADTAFVEQYSRARDIADAVVAAMAESKKAEPPAKRGRDAPTPQELEIEMDKRRRMALEERLRSAPEMWKAKTGALDAPQNDALPYDAPATFEEWKKVRLSGGSYEPKLVRFATPAEAHAHMAKMLKGDAGNGYTFTETRVQSAAGVPEISFRDILRSFTAV